ncbi:acyl-CoA thioester hydrolase/BAAT C-terminal domain-containing protein [Xanthomonas sp. 1678]|uniref:acyl-CoA thioester hydrolase/BAAT C-terminal domain-containing protein n=1 Tax=Xanthomonas sp. 1678 TaxID=3158788 RepID=UPI002861F442|nr:dienelactone hydrolase [Xanthomonas translucens]
MTIRFGLAAAVVWLAGCGVATAQPIDERSIETATLSATLYTPEDTAAHPAVLVLGGAEGGRAWAKRIARRLAEQGYVALAQSYFNGPGLPSQLSAIPLERLQAGVDYLAQQGPAAPPRIAVLGLSKGAEAALTLAAHDARIAAVVAASPSDVVWQGIDRSGGAAASSWTLAGTPLAYVPFTPCPDCKGLLDLYTHSGKAVAADSPARIAVERIHGPVLLIASAQDQVWPSAQMADAIAERLQRRQFAHQVSVLQYPQGGHFAFGLAPTETTLQEDIGFGGGTPSGLTEARADSWTRTTAFLDAALRDTGDTRPAAPVR